ncbi:hypothetical protein TNCV_1966831 [Trichonephila clavipes]|nr:hypothetical protein TNCV_1966831 [Trichonephila clavipes]
MSHRDTPGEQGRCGSTLVQVLAMHSFTDWVRCVGAMSCRRDQSEPELRFFHDGFRETTSSRCVYPQRFV